MMSTLRLWKLSINHPLATRAAPRASRAPLTARDTLRSGLVPAPNTPVTVSSERQELSQVPRTRLYVSGVGTLSAQEKSCPYNSTYDRARALQLSGSPATKAIHKLLHPLPTHPPAGWGRYSPPAITSRSHRRARVTWEGSAGSVRNRTSNTPPGSLGSRPWPPCSSPSPPPPCWPSPAPGASLCSG